MKDIWIGFVEVNSLLEDRLIVAMKRQATAVVHARTLEIAGLHFEDVIFSVPILVDPSADRVTRKGRLLVRRKGAPIGIDSAQRVVVGDDDVSHIRCDDKLQWPERNHHPGHAGCDTPGMLDVIALTTRALIRDAVLQNFLIFGCKRGLLPKSVPLRLIKRGRAWNPRDDDPAPLTLQVWVLRVIQCLRVAEGCEQRYGLHKRTERFPVKHGCPPWPTK